MGKTIGAVLISYDINKLHSEIKSKMQELGYYDNWKYRNGPKCQMPNTTLWHKSKSADTAIKDLENTCYRLGVTLEGSCCSCN